MRRFAAILAVLSWVIIGCGDDDAKEAEGCKEGQIKCDGICIDPNTNMNFCGATASCSGDDKGSKCTTDQTCTAGKCVDKGVCTANVCSDGKIQVCANGNLGVAANCAGEASCKSATECGECKNGILECNDSKIKTCENGLWKEGADCKTDSKICVAGACTEASSCDANICANGKIQICGEDHKLQSEKACDGETSCKSTSECGECKDGSLKCDDTKIMICENGLWKEDVDCNAENKTCLAGTCMAKSCGTSICKDGKLQVCGEDNTLQPEKACDGDASCKNGSECGECKNDAFECTTETGYKLCSAGQWKTEACTDNKVCNVEAKGCGCVENTFECTETGYRICKEGEWEPEACASNETCDPEAKNCASILMDITRYEAANHGTQDSGLLGRWGTFTVQEAGSASNNLMMYIFGGMAQDPVDLNTTALAVNIKNIDNIGDYEHITLSFKYAGATATSCKNLTIGVFDGAALVGEPILVSATLPGIITATNALPGEYSIVLSDSIAPAALSVRLAATISSGSLRLDDIIVTGIKKK